MEDEIKTAAKAFGAKGGKSKSDKKVSAARINVAKAAAARVAYKMENVALRQRINEMRLCMLDAAPMIKDEEWRKHVILIAGDVA